MRDPTHNFSWHPVTCRRGRSSSKFQEQTSANVSLKESEDKDGNRFQTRIKERWERKRKKKGRESEGRKREKRHDVEVGKKKFVVRRWLSPRGWIDEVCPHLFDPKRCSVTLSVSLSYNS